MSEQSTVQGEKSLDLRSRRAVVTGASSGIGAAIARHLAMSGARVAGLARRKDRLDVLAVECGVIAVPTDLADLQATSEAVEYAAQVMGGLDLVVNAAGVMLLGSFSTGRAEDWRQMFDVNVLGLLMTTRAALPYLRASGCGDIVNISSMAGHRVPSPAGAVYAATKFAVNALSEGMRLELGQEGIRTCIISPGLVATNLADAVGDPVLREATRVLQGELGISPDEIAVAVLHAVTRPRNVLTFEIVVLPTHQGTTGVGSISPSQGK